PPPRTGHPPAPADDRDEPGTYRDHMAAPPASRAPELGGAPSSSPRGPRRRLLGSPVQGPVRTCRPSGLSAPRRVPDDDEGSRASSLLRTARHAGPVDADLVRRDLSRTRRRVLDRGDRLVLRAACTHPVEGRPRVVRREV